MHRTVRRRSRWQVQRIGSGWAGCIWRGWRSRRWHSRRSKTIAGRAGTDQSRVPSTADIYISITVNVSKSDGEGVLGVAPPARVRIFGGPPSPVSELAGTIEGAPNSVAPTDTCIGISVAALIRNSEGLCLQRRNSRSSRLSNWPARERRVGGHDKIPSLPVYAHARPDLDVCSVRRSVALYVDAAGVRSKDPSVGKKSKRLKMAPGAG